MTGQKIHAGIVTGIVAVGIVVIATIEITGAGDTPGGVPCIPGIPFQITAERVTVSAVPFCPAAACREASYLIKTAGIPCFSNQFYVA